MLKNWPDNSGSCSLRRMQEELPFGRQMREGVQNQSQEQIRKPFCSSFRLVVIRHNNLRQPLQGTASVALAGT